VWVPFDKRTLIRCPAVGAHETGQRIFRVVDGGEPVRRLVGGKLAQQGAGN
jgi:hypothetical protein